MWIDAVGRLDLGSLVALEHVLDDERMEPERAATGRELGGGRIHEVDPQRWPSGRAAGRATRPSPRRHRMSRATCRAAPSGGRVPARCDETGTCAGSSARRWRPVDRSEDEVGLAAAIAGQHTLARGRRGPPATAERQGRDDRDDVTTAATTNRPTMIDAASRDAQVSSASTTSGSRSGRSRRSSGMQLEIRVGGGVDVGRQAVDRRRAVGGQDGQADGHPDHPGDRHDRRRHPERPPGRRPRRRPSSAA